MENFGVKLEVRLNEKLNVIFDEKLKIKLDV